MINKIDLIEGAYYIGTCRNTNIARWINNEFLFINLNFKQPYLEKIQYYGDVKNNLNIDGFIPIKKIDVEYNDIMNVRLEQDYKNSARKIYKNLSISNLDGEIWEDIPEYEGLYYVSNYGRIKKHDGNYIMKQNFSREYLVIGLTGYDGKHKTMRVHRLVALTFKPNDNSDFEVNHINGIKSDNRDANLEWLSHTENSKKTFILGNKTKKLTPIMVKEIKELLSDREVLQKDIAKKYGVSASTICEINKNKKWTNIKRGD